MRLTRSRPEAVKAMRRGSSSGEPGRERPLRHFARPHHTRPRRWRRPHERVEVEGGPWGQPLQGAQEVDAVEPQHEADHVAAGPAGQRRSAPPAGSTRSGGAALSGPPAGPVPTAEARRRVQRPPRRFARLQRRSGTAEDGPLGARQPRFRPLSGRGGPTAAGAEPWWPWASAASPGAAGGPARSGGGRRQPCRPPPWSGGWTAGASASPLRGAVIPPSPGR